MKTTANQLFQLAEKAGFQFYGSFNEGLQHDIMTCMKGKYDGEVIDIYYDYITGDVKNVEYSTQFNGQLPTFKF